MNQVLAIGVMTGNSLDGADLVLTEFGADGKIKDLCTHFLPFDADLYKPVRALQRAVADAQGNMHSVADSFQWQSDTETLDFDALQNRYIQRVADAIAALINKAKSNTELASRYNLDAIDIIGLHGQTCDHCPPSRLRTLDEDGKLDADRVYSVQMGNGQQLADLTNMTVIYDFRSDDLMQGGEAAPLAPIHNQHLANHTKQAGQFPIAFCNAGNTGNIALITHDIDQPENLKTLGWDTGPFNHYPDLLIRSEYSDKTCDHNGEIGKSGAINIDLLRTLFNEAAQLENGENYLLLTPPKSADPNYYQLLPALEDQSIPFADRLRTAEYFSAYAFVHSLSLTPASLALPRYFATFGGGWLNPISFAHFKGLLTKGPENLFQGGAHQDSQNPLNTDKADHPILPEHQVAFESVWSRLAAARTLASDTTTPEATAPETTTSCANQSTSEQTLSIESSQHFGFDGQAMEARIFADMAYCRLIGEPFSTPDTTGAKRPVVGGIIRYPKGDPNQATETVKALLKTHKTEHITPDQPDQFDPRWSRASAGWAARLKHPN